MRVCVCVCVCGVCPIVHPLVHPSQGEAAGLRLPAREESLSATGEHSQALGGQGSHDNSHDQGAHDNSHDANEQRQRPGSLRSQTHAGHGYRKKKENKMETRNVSLEHLL